MNNIDENLALQLYDEHVALISGSPGGQNVNGWLLARRGLRTSATVTLKKLDQINPLLLPQAQALHDKIAGLIKGLGKLDGDIRDYMIKQGLWSDDQFLKDFELCENYQDNLQYGLQSLQIEINSLTATTIVPSAIQSNPGINNPKMSLPKLSLPEFDGRIENYNKFITQFEATMSKFTVTPFEKFSYLEKQLRGSARDLIDSIPISDMDDQIYQTARSLLDKAYLDNNAQRNAVIKRLIDLRMDESQPFKWISEARIIDEQIKLLKVDSNIFVQFFLWQSLSDSYRNQLINISATSRPSLKQILDNVFEAHTRIADSHISAGPSVEKSSGNRGTVALVATANEKSRSSQPVKEPKCVLCNEAHRASKCAKYATSDKKIKRLQDLKICDKCMLRNHEGKDCRFKFKFKCSCGGDHYQFLCNNSSSGAKPKETKNKEKSKEEATISHVVISMACNNKVQDTLLPSFTASIEDSGGNIKNCRGFYDTCSQSTLIETDLAKALKLKVVERDINLTIKGINSECKVATEKVEFRILVGKKSYLIKALCVPRINIKLQLHDVHKLASEFESKKYVLADKFLKDRFLGARFLLGSDYASILPTRTCLFGSEEKGKACFLQSPLGIMFLGSLSNLLQSVEHLEVCQEENREI